MATTTPRTTPGRTRRWRWTPRQGLAWLYAYSIPEHPYTLAASSFPGPTTRSMFSFSLTVRSLCTRALAVSYTLAAFSSLDLWHGNLFPCQLSLNVRSYCTRVPVYPCTCVPYTLAASSSLTMSEGRSAVGPALWGKHWRRRWAAWAARARAGVRGGAAAGAGSMGYGLPLHCPTLPASSSIDNLNPRFLAC